MEPLDNGILFKLKHSIVYKRIIKRLMPHKIREYIVGRLVNLTEKLSHEGKYFRKLCSISSKLKVKDAVYLIITDVQHIPCYKKNTIIAYWGGTDGQRSTGKNTINIPLDFLQKRKEQFFETLFKNTDNKYLLVMSPYPHITQVIEIANSFGWKTIYDIDGSRKACINVCDANTEQKKIERRIAYITDIIVARSQNIPAYLNSVVENKPFYITSDIQGTLELLKEIEE